jgi:hypothetical protein
MSSLFSPKPGGRAGVSGSSKETRIMKTKIAVALALFVGLCAVAPSAHADPPRRDGNYGYTFPDDDMLGKDLVGTMPIIPMRAMGRRAVLHRPRVQFIQEMLKSVENM